MTRPDRDRADADENERFTAYFHPRLSALARSMSETCPITRAVSQDACAMRECVRAAYRHYVRRMGKEPGPMLDDYAGRVEKDEAYVIRLAGKIVGVLVLIMDDQRCLLDNVAVCSECQGRGLGRKLIDFAEQRAKQLGYKQIELYTHEVMTENIEIYKRLGYGITRRVSEKGYERIYMQKPLW